MALQLILLAGLVLRQETADLLAMGVKLAALGTFVLAMLTLVWQAAWASRKVVSAVQGIKGIVDARLTSLTVEVHELRATKEEHIAALARVVAIVDGIEHRLSRVEDRLDA